jgi:hypothetical protein
VIIVLLQAAVKRSQEASTPEHNRFLSEMSSGVMLRGCGGSLNATEPAIMQPDCGDAEDPPSMFGGLQLLLDNPQVNRGGSQHAGKASAYQR